MGLDFYDTHETTSEQVEVTASGQRRPYICILFDCCNVYARLYRRPEVLRYEGRCPKCLRTLTVGVGPDGTSNRMFRAQ
jgi:hypothetical protein